MTKSFMERLQTLLARLTCVGLDTGIAAPLIIAAWGLYRFVQAGG